MMEGGEVIGRGGKRVRRRIEGKRSRGSVRARHGPE